MLQHTGNLYQDVTPGGFVLVGTTTNNVIKSNGELVMGKGAAAGMAARYPDCAREFATRIQRDQVNGFYGVVVYGPARLFAFQTKFHWRNPSPIVLIERSAQKLQELMDRFPGNDWHMPMPGVSNGGLNPREVLPIFKSFGDNLHLWSLG